MDLTLNDIAQRIDALQARLEQVHALQLQCLADQAERHEGRNESLKAVQESIANIETALAMQGRKKLTVPEAARHARKKASTIRRWLADGRLKATKVGDKKQSRWYIRRQDLDAFLERNTNSPQ